VSDRPYALGFTETGIFYEPRGRFGSVETARKRIDEDLAEFESKRIPLPSGWYVVHVYGRCFYSQGVGDMAGKPLPDFTSKT
jgi:hypothetical protein